MSEVRYVLDASALLAAMLGEAGAERVDELLPHAVIGAVNVAEVIGKLQERGVPDSEIDLSLAELDLTVAPFDRAQAERAGKLRRGSRALGLSLGDRCCLALAGVTGAVAVTTDTAWSRLGGDAGVTVEVVR